MELSGALGTEAFKWENPKVARGRVRVRVTGRVTDLMIFVSRDSPPDMAKH